MSDINEFQVRLNHRIEQARREPRWSLDAATKYMADFEGRRSLFESIASELISTVIKPRIAMLASQFSNACLVTDSPFNHVAYWFGYCEQFPACTSLAFAVEHDVSLDTISVTCEVSMMPMFIKLNERDRLRITLEQIDKQLVADWTEQRLFDFLDGYLQIDRGSAEFEEDVATDPVCGMRITRSAAVSTDSYRGHPYFFCSQSCQEKFAAKPTDYVNVRAM